MADLSVEFCGFRFPNPIVLASGYPIGRFGSGVALKRMAEAGAGGITARTVLMDRVTVGSNIRPRYGIDGKYLVHFDGITEAAAEFFGKQADIAKVDRVPLIASIFGKSMDDFHTLGAMADTSRAVDMIEVNVSCPALEHFSMKYKMLRPNISQMPDLVVDILRTVRKATHKPLIAKLSIQADNLGETARAAVAGGANALSAVNTLPNGLAAIDIETGRPGLPILGPYGGAGLRHLAMGAVVQIRKAVSEPVLGIGGVFTWRDAVEMIMAGASLVGQATAVLFRGPAIFKEMTTGIEKFMNSHHYARVQDMCGIALPHIYTPEDMPEFDLVARIHGEDCTRCAQCLEVCAYNAIELEPEPVIDEEECVACTLCRNICPADAVTLTTRKRA
ncbi:MAG: 4Fe-4S dicluster-binding protein [Thermodesulfobacteriota bacterium]